MTRRANASGSTEQEATCREAERLTGCCCETPPCQALRPASLHCCVIGPPFPYLTPTGSTATVSPRAKADANGARQRCAPSSPAWDRSSPLEREAWRTNPCEELATRSPLTDNDRRFKTRPRYFVKTLL
jgi:hypothetical protein